MTTIVSLLMQLYDIVLKTIAYFKNGGKQPPQANA